MYLGAGAFSLLHIQEQYAYSQNLTATLEQSSVYLFAHSLDQIPIPDILLSFFKTLSATFFQNSVLAGILIASGLLYFSRIAFSLSLLGFFTAYLFFKLVGVDTILLTQYLVGSNFIFLSIAIGGFYLVPSKWSYFWVILLVPVLSIFMISLEKWMIIFQLKTFTLSFSLVVILFLFFVNNRLFQKFFQMVSIQYYSAEKTIYKHLSSTRRLKNLNLARFSLPFWGSWKVSQGYQGKITHLGPWAHALDFVIVDGQDKTYKYPGAECNDFFSYNKPVVAPLDGYIYDIVSSQQDNLINNVNTQENWGNTIVINHANGLFSQLSHLKPDSVKVAVGEYVTKGTVLALCGNSGRSPEPHLHFQVQLTPKIGEVTYPYPIAYYIKTENGKQEICTYSIPKENDLISNVDVNVVLAEAYNLQPGKTLRLQNENNHEDYFEWKIVTDAWNRTMIYCAKSKSTLWFINDGTMFYCYDFEGDRKSLLFDFYLANYRIFLATYQDIKINDTYPIHVFSNRIWLLIQDFLAPFYQFLKVKFAKEVLIDEENDSGSYIIKSRVSGQVLNYITRSKEFELFINEKGITSFHVRNKNVKTYYLCALS